LWREKDGPTRRTDLGERRFAESEIDEHVSGFKESTPRVLFGALIACFLMNDGHLANATKATETDLWRTMAARRDQDRSAKPRSTFCNEPSKTLRSGLIESETPRATA
jgi:hypothetical protein